ncbi:MAG TPA: aldehyde dehydrogenase family protein [Acidimicrobiales bacterium]|nr:aldehyde dehydrogenase family protein [Acidimicrobiales bacterium]
MAGAGAGAGSDAPSIRHRDRLYIDGTWAAASKPGTHIEVFNPATEEATGSVPEGAAADADAAVRAARAAFEDWSATPPAERGRYLAAIGAGLQERIADIAAVVAEEVGTPVNFSALVHGGLPVMTFSVMPQILAEITFEERVGNSLVLLEPVGVVAGITPWNYPLHQLAAKVAPALAAGCTMVAKPSELAPLSAFILADVVHEVGLPPGVFNLVSGTGPEVGEALVVHPEVDLVSFTGSVATGRRVTELAAASVKPVALELGGKSATVILDDADLPSAVSAGVTGAFLNSGQTCSALTRMLVPRGRLEEAEALAAAAAGQYTPGDPFEPTTRLGPLVSERQRRRVWDFIEQGLADGARLVAGGSGAPEGQERGWFVRPTIFSDVDPRMSIAQEEIFGPVLAMIPYDSEEDAVAIANGTAFGLSGAVWSADAERAQRVARRLRSGQVAVNGGAFNPLAPFGGFKQSGHGRELGRHGVEEFMTTKALQL